MRTVGVLSAEPRQVHGRRIRSMPWSVSYEARTLSGRPVRVEARYDDGRPDDFGNVVEYAYVVAVRDPLTGHPVALSTPDILDLDRRSLEESRRATTHQRSTPKSKLRTEVRVQAYRVRRHLSRSLWAVVPTALIGTGVGILLLLLSWATVRLWGGW